MTYSNKDIVEGLKRGDKEILHKVYDQYNSLLVAYARHTVRNPLLAEDFVQDAFCTLWETREKLKPELPVQSFLYKIVYSRCVDFLRKQQAHSNYTQKNEIQLQELEISQPHLENFILSEIVVKEVQSALEVSFEDMSEQTREIFHLSRYQYLTNNEIAEKTGLSVKSIEYHISKALQQLRKSLQEFL